MDDTIITTGSRPTHVSSAPPAARADDEAVRWLTEPEQDAWRGFLEAARGLFDVLEKQLTTDAGMPMTYYDVLVTLSEAPDHALRMGDLARRLRCSASRLTHAMTRLEESGWVRRDPIPTDRRGAVAVLTPEGQDALTAAAPGHVAAVRRHLIERLTPEQVTQLAEISRAITGTPEDPPLPTAP